MNRLGVCRFTGIDAFLFIPMAFRLAGFSPKLGDHALPQIASHRIGNNARYGVSWSAGSIGNDYRDWTTWIWSRGGRPNCEAQ